MRGEKYYFCLVFFITTVFLGQQYIFLLLMINIISWKG